MKIIKRVFTFGDKWLYYKIYLGEGSADQLLVENIYPLIISLLKDKLINKWFFIRYRDPDFHIRIRFNLSDNPKALLSTINSIKIFLELKLESGLIWKYKIDTYSRELERYGNQTMDISESIFSIDSMANLEFFKLVKGEDDNLLRCLYGLKSIDNLLNGFSFNLKEKLELLFFLKTEYGKEFGMCRELKKQLDTRYRNYREDIELFFNPKIENKILSRIFNNAQNNYSIISEKIFELEKKNKIEVKINDLLINYIHMMMNRLFESRNRLSEMICYDFLYRHYESLNARSKYDKTC